MIEASKGAALAEWRPGWSVALSAMVGMTLCSIHLYSTGVMIFPLEQAFGWSRAQISGGALIVGCTGALMGPLVGSAIDRIGPRRIGLFGAVVFLIAFALLSLAGPSIWSWWGLWLLLAVATAFVAPTVWAAAVTSRFRASRGLALAVALSGSGVSIVVVPMVASWALQRFGWRGGYVAISLLWACVALPLLWLWFRGASDRDAALEAAPPLTGLPARQVFRSFKYARLTIAACSLLTISAGLIVNMVPIIVSDGLDKATAVTIASLSGIGVVVGRLIGGWFLDRINANLVAAVSVLFPIGTAFFLLAFPGNFHAAVAASLMLGLSLGAEIDSVAYLTSRHFGLLSFGALFGAIVGLMNMISGLGPLIANMVYDVTRSYDAFLWIAIPGCLFASALFLSLGRYPDSFPPAE